MFGSSFDRNELRLDADYQTSLPEFFDRSEKLEPADLPQALRLLFDRAGGPRSS